MQDLSTIGGRLRHFARTNYGTVTALCRALGKPPSSFSRYLSGYSVPGAKMQGQLRALGCDIEWLMTGRELSATGSAPLPTAATTPTPSPAPEPIVEKSNVRDVELDEVMEDYKMTKDALKLALRDNYEKARIIEELQILLAARGGGTSLPLEAPKPSRV